MTQRMACIGALCRAQARSQWRHVVVGNACISAKVKSAPSITMRTTGKIGYKVKPEVDNTQVIC